MSGIYKRYFAARNCVCCGKPFTIDHPRRKLCGDCRHPKCAECGKELPRVMARRLKDGRQRHCWGCRRAAKKKSLPPRRVALRLTSYAGYVHVFFPEHPRAHCTGYVPEHIVVAEEMLGRPLKPSEVVHHRNEDKTDNRPENLAVETRGQHTKRHHPKILAARWPKGRKVFGYEAG